ncbi:MarR family winged helix-turn-helix transcriptional regulator [Nocardia blacklockiae]|uniref:MarR family winged helix-turn-helix transcriptional regulator n=1 Tax=Nocardia blacklockiae TaxID=480036 RepID=UPI00189577B6|nr:MarR family winged helix-turn-helix transcriptional regulator [Nocardia blacklockiae]MBF6171004.1 winged helix-turn-helix transcriptional regulator [Nocardia blacklockiae]
MTEPPIASPREWALWTSFFPMEGELWQWLGRRLRDDANLSEADWQVLDALGNTPGHALRAFVLAERISFSKPRLHQHAARMMKRGLLEQHPAPEDGRGTVLALTDAGLACFRRAQVHRAGHIRAALVDALSPEELDTLIALSTKIRRHLRRLEAES